MSEPILQEGSTTVEVPSPSKDVVVTNFTQGGPAESQPTKLDAIKAASEKSTAVKPADPKAPAIGAPGAAPAVPAYQPNFKIKVLKQEKEMDEFFRSLVKDKDSEEKVRQTLQKAEALEAYEKIDNGIRAEHEKMSKTYGALDKSLKQLSKYLNEDDMESYCHTLQIDDAKILRYAQRILQKLEMDPNQRAEAERIKQERFRSYQLENQNQELTQSFQMEQARTGLMQTEMLLAQPQLANVAASFDNQAKREGAFLEQVCMTAANIENQTGRVLTPQEAVQETLKIWGPFIPQSQAQPQATAQFPGAQATPQAPAPTLPNVSGRATSPIKKSVKSIADLKKLASTF